MAVNKVKLSNGETLIDISGDTVTQAALAEGVTAHDKSGAKITGTLKTNCKIYEVTLAKATGWVLMTTLDDEVVAHINDAHLIVSLVRISDYEYEQQCVNAGIATNTPVGYQGTYPAYGCSSMMSTRSDKVAQFPCYYPPNNTETSTSIGGRLVFRLSGNNYYVSIPSYFIATGTYRLTFTW